MSHFNPQIKSGKLRLRVGELCTKNDKVNKWERQESNSEHYGSGTLVPFIAPDPTTSHQMLVWPF